MNLYILEGRKIVKTTDIKVYSNFFGDISKRRLGSDTIDGIHLSTVFLGIDHSYVPEGYPILFETMSFGNVLSSECIFYRYKTYNAAYNTHRRLVKLIKGMFNLPMNSIPLYINYNDFRGEIATYRLNRGR